MDRDLYPLMIDRSLTEDIDNSGVLYVAKDDGYGEAEVRSILDESRGIFHFFEFFYGLETSEGEPYRNLRNQINSRLKKIIVLGLDFRDNYNNAAVVYGGHRWDEAYEQLNIERSEPGHTQKLMQMITDESSTYVPVFCIPPNFSKEHRAGFGENGTTVTYAEFLWLLKNPEKARQVYFVFGGTDYLNSDFHSESITKPPFRTIQERQDIYNNRFNQFLEMINPKNKGKLRRS